MDYLGGFLEEQDKVYRHGGDIYHNNVKYDFSVNTNPLGMSPLVKQKLYKSLDMFEKYPDIQCLKLRKEIAAKENIPVENILCANGASEIFKLVTEAVKPERAVITAPAFSGYEYALRTQNTKIEYYYLNEEKDFAIDTDIISKIPAGCDIIFLCSPNNPSGRVISKKVFLGILEYCRINNIYLVADECFLGFVPGYEALSMKSEIESQHLIVVNAFTKLYAMAGLRLGWCVCGNKELLKKMQHLQPEWSVSVPAQIAGIYALNDKDYIEKTISLIAKERIRMSGFFAAKGIKVFPSDANFLLVKTEVDLYKKLLAKHILIRKCSNFNGLGEGFYRIAIRSYKENNILMEALGEYI